MNSVLEKQLVTAINRRWYVLAAKAKNGNLLTDEMSLRAAACMAGDILLPCCCMLCSKEKLTKLLVQTELCCNDKILTEKLVSLVYEDLARCNGLG